MIFALLSYISQISVDYFRNPRGYSGRGPRLRLHRREIPRLHIICPRPQHNRIPQRHLLRPKRQHRLIVPLPPPPPRTRPWGSNTTTGFK